MPLRLASAWWSIGALLVIAVIVLSLLPPGEGQSLLPDKLVHFATYFILGAWFVSLTSRHGMALLGVILLGGALELLQGLTPQRQPEWLDLLANTSGALLAAFTVRLLPANLFRWIENQLGMHAA